ncbi:MAG: Mur ligase domain-containing protein, partial [Puniceicoccales bacterium]|nr:Mur ligase domain-containing protein [Puniceicoccales bacterium]
PSPDRPIEGVAIDSRRIRPGELFVAIRTERDDGHHYLVAAAAQGAAAAIVEHFDGRTSLPQLVVRDSLEALRALAAAWRRSWSGTVIAIAGSYGKTTCKELLALLLGRGCTCATEGNLNNTIGVPLSILSLDRERHRFAAIEVGISKPGEMATIAEVLRPDHVVFTGISSKHLEFFPSRAALLQEKLCICRAAADRGGRIAVLPKFARRRPFRPFREHILSPLPDVNRYLLPDLSPTFREDLALCLAFCEYFSIPVHSISERLQLWRPPPLRGQIFFDGGRAYFVDCYNSDLPALLHSARAFARRFPRQPRCYVIGGMGELGADSELLHRRAGRNLPFSRNDRFFLVGPETVVLGEELLRRGLLSDRLKIFPDKAALAAALSPIRGPIYLKGSRCYALETLVDLGGCEIL